MSQETDDFQTDAKSEKVKKSAKSCKSAQDNEIKTKNSSDNSIILLKVSEKWMGSRFLKDLLNKNADLENKPEKSIQRSKNRTFEIEYIHPTTHSDNESSNSSLNSNVNSFSKLASTTDSESDIELPGGVHILIITESDYMGTNTYKRRMARFYKATKNCSSSIVICAKSAISAKYFQDLQIFCVIELGLPLIPIADNIDVHLPQVIAQLVNVTDPRKIKKNPFKFGIIQKENVKPKNDAICSTSADLTKTMCTIPGINEMKAKLLIEKFGCIVNVSEATLKDLSEIVGESAAFKIKYFFQGKN